MFTSMIIVLLVGTPFIKFFSARQILDPIREDGPTEHIVKKIGTPTIAILLVENAKDDTMGWHEVGSVDNIGWWNDENLVLNLKKSIELLKDKNTRQRMQDKGAPYTTPNGAVNLVNRVLGN